MRTGLLYRSGGLHAVCQADADALARLAVRTVYDLRLAHEQAAAPDRLPPGTRHVPADVLAAWTDGGPTRLFELFENPAAAREALGNGAAEAMWVDQYRTFVRLPSARDSYGALFRDLADPAHRPALVHCTTGKDRTGWAVAALQLLLEVPESAVMEHYLESRHRIASLVEPALDEFARRGGDPDLLRPVFDVRPGYLEAAIDEVRLAHGSIEAYFADGLGVDMRTQEEIRVAFLG